jgi:hypothetical protein
VLLCIRGSRPLLVQELEGKGNSGNSFVDRVLSLLLFSNSVKVSLSDSISWYEFSDFTVVFHVFQGRTVHNTAYVVAELEALLYHVPFISV